MFVLGQEFWEGVFTAFGGTIASIAQALLPHKFGHNTGMDYQVFQANSTEVSFEIEFQSMFVLFFLTYELLLYFLKCIVSTNTKCKTIHKNLNKLTPNTPLVLQVR